MSYVVVQHIYARVPYTNRYVRFLQTVIEMAFMCRVVLPAYRQYIRHGYRPWAGSSIPEKVWSHLHQWNCIHHLGNALVHPVILHSGWCDLENGKDYFDNQCQIFFLDIKTAWTTASDRWKDTPLGLAGACQYSCMTSSLSPRRRQWGGATPHGLSSAVVTIVTWLEARPKLFQPLTLYL